MQFLIEVQLWLPKVYYMPFRASEFLAVIPPIPEPMIAILLIIAPVNYSHTVNSLWARQYINSAVNSPVAWL